MNPSPGKINAFSVPSAQFSPWCFIFGCRWWRPSIRLRALPLSANNIHREISPVTLGRGALAFPGRRVSKTTLSRALFESYRTRPDCFACVIVFISRVTSWSSQWLISGDLFLESVRPLLNRTRGRCSRTGSCRYHRRILNQLISRVGHLTLKWNARLIILIKWTEL